MNSIPKDTKEHFINDLNCKINQLKVEKNKVLRSYKKEIKELVQVKEELNNE